MWSIQSRLILTEARCWGTQQCCSARALPRGGSWSAFQLAGVGESGKGRKTTPGGDRGARRGIVRRVDEKGPSALPLHAASMTKSSQPSTGAADTSGKRKYRLSRIMRPAPLLVTKGQKSISPSDPMA